MFRIAICDDSKSDIEQLETALDALRSLQIDYDVYCSAGGIAGMHVYAQGRVSLIYF